MEKERWGEVFLSRSFLLLAVRFFQVLFFNKNKSTVSKD